MNSGLPDHAGKMQGFGLLCLKHRKYAANLASPCETRKTARNSVNTYANAKRAFRAGQARLRTGFAVNTHTILIRRPAYDLPHG